MYKERKETTHGKIGEITNISTMYVKWSQDQCTRYNVSKRERKEKIQKIFTTSLNIHSPYLLN